MKHKYKENIKRMLAIGIFSVLILAMVMIVIPNNANAATTHYVGPTGSGADFNSIQSAINDINTKNGDTIRVWAGTYSENVVVNKRLNIIGNSTLDTIIDGGGSGDVVRITADKVNMTKFTINNSGSNLGDAGIELYYNKECNLYKLIITNNSHGIYMDQSDSNSIGKSTDNVIFKYNVRNSIKLSACWYNNFTNIEISQTTSGESSVHDSAVYYSNANYWNDMDNTTITENYDTSSGLTTYYNGIQLGSTISSSNSNNDFKNCEIKNCKNGIYIIGGSSSTEQNLFEQNKIHLNNEHGIYIDGGRSNRIQLCKTSGSDTWGIYDNDDHGIYLNNSKSNNINDNYIYDNNDDNDNTGDGIYTSNCEGNPSGNTIYKNGIYNTASGNQRYGIHFYNSTDAYIQNHNDIYDGDYGIYKNKLDGIFLDSCSESGSTYDRIQGNLIHDNEDNGVHLLDCREIRIINDSTTGNRNKIYNNKYDGILLEDSDNNTIDDNIIFNNGSGTQQHGIHLKKDSGDGICTNNTISGNNSVFHNEEHGIYFEYADYNDIDGGGVYENNYDNDSTGDGFRLEHSDNNEIDSAFSNNSNTGTGYQIHGYRLEDSDDNLINGGNALYNKDDGIYLDSTSDDNTMQSISILENEGNGVFIEGTSANNDQPLNNVIGSNCDIQYNDENGVYLKYCGSQNSENFVTTCEIRNNADHGIKLDNSDFNKIEYNWIYNHDDSGEAGIYLTNSDNNKIKYNTIGTTNSGNEYGIFLTNSDSTTITDNNIEDNDNYGVNISDTGSSSNIVYHNDFIDNNNGDVQAYDDGSSNWDNGYTDPILDTETEGGNYWNDHDDEDEGVYDGYSGSSQNNAGPDQIADDGDPVGGKNEYLIDSTQGSPKDDYPFVIALT